MAARGRGGGKTPARVIELLQEAVAASSIRAVARESGLTQSAVYRYLQGVGEPTTATLEKLAKYFGITVWELRGSVARPGVFFDDEDYAAVLDDSDFVSFGKRVFNIMSESNSPDEAYYKIRRIYLDIVANKCDSAAKQAGSDASIYVDDKGLLTVEQPNGKKTTFITD